MSSQSRRVNDSSNDVIRRQWDSIACARDKQLRSGQDTSFEYILKPAIFSLIEGVDKASVLDAGCGTGVLTELLAKQSSSVTGVDFSSVNIAIAKRAASSTDNIRYVSQSIEEFAASAREYYSLIVANMVLQDVKALDACLAAMASLSTPNATLVATVTHPCFWPTYWGYDQEPWFDYNEEQAIEAPFRISASPQAIGVTTHFHRPVSAYLNSFCRAGFIIDAVLEPMPASPSLKLPMKISRIPRFLAFRCIYQPSGPLSPCS